MRIGLRRALRSRRSFRGWLAGRLAALRYRMLRRTPSSDVADDVLADRVRSTLGPVEKRLDLPRLHVMVEDGIAVLHGAVSTGYDEAELVRAVAAVPGVEAVDARLHLGLTRADSRPSEGRQRAEQSVARRELAAAAADAADLVEPGLTAAVSAVLSTLMERLPRDEREHLLSHLPEDVRVLAHRPRSPRAASTSIRTKREFAEAVEELALLDGAEGITGPIRALVVSRAVLAALRRLVPEEVADVAAVLPAELRELWGSA